MLIEIWRPHIYVTWHLHAHITYMTHKWHIWHAQHITRNLRFVTNLRYTCFRMPKWVTFYTTFHICTRKCVHNWMQNANSVVTCLLRFDDHTYMLHDTSHIWHRSSNLMTFVWHLYGTFYTSHFWRHLLYVCVVKCVMCQMCAYIYSSQIAQSYHTIYMRVWCSSMCAHVTSHIWHTNDTFDMHNI